MVQLFSRVRAALLIAVGAAVLNGCAGTVAPEVKRLPERVELSGTFYRGEANQSGPQVLASLLSQRGIVITPGLLEKPLQLPGAEDKLQRNIENLAREYGMLVYPLDSNLPALLTQVAAGYPVMVRFSEGSAFWAEPRYAILSGYDRNKQNVLLRAGMNRRQLMSFSAFESALEKSGGWAILIQKPSQIPAAVDQQRWLKAADALAQAGQENEAAQARKALAAH
ncbi:peptidase C39 family protein [Pseudomonas granadensis]|uniref:peptidase C39 family protein n=1 Tax=Pseudomonas granadensis TaxID=1421430 RepID=UPI0019D12EF1|nr:peptidase C39 family protein [Pseudomonas granadensis]MBN6776617.1 peptidase C39 family protein [Pseudomonas granadensis]MBN6807867.1 peptidase C39 family protein [Pseudomonas granadensis]MBN6834556.1 peptidase C39 family protein [Pseudomonas granadensis]MBN6842113.1 peptidase C39 family protein [Pseudomonas granadensis]MBN6870756.1 peptidase C39 family protein [Pseudomonas granadensis]